MCGDLYGKKFETEQQMRSTLRSYVYWVKLFVRWCATRGT